MTTLSLAGRGEAADLVAFLTRLLRYDRAAVVRLQTYPASDRERPAALVVFGRVPLGGDDVVAIRTARLAAPGPAGTGPAEPVDVTVAAGPLLEGVDEERARLPLPAAVAGTSWARDLPPRTGWYPSGEPQAGAVAAAVAQAVAEFRARSESLASKRRPTRVLLNALADEIWSRPLDAAPPLPLRAAHAAHVLGFLRPDAPLGVHTAGAWMRLSAPHGSVAVRRADAPGAGLGLTSQT